MWWHYLFDRLRGEDCKMKLKKQYFTNPIYDLVRTNTKWNCYKCNKTFNKGTISFRHLKFKSAHYCIDCTKANINRLLADRVISTRQLKDVLINIEKYSQEIEKVNMLGNLGADMEIKNENL